MFDEILSTRLEKIKTILGAKAKEYASNDDRFHNFNVAGRIAGVTPEKALYGMMLKHEVSVTDLIELAGAEPSKLNEAIIDEKICEIQWREPRMLGMARQSNQGGDSMKCCRCGENALTAYEFKNYKSRFAVWFSCDACGKEEINFYLPPVENVIPLTEGLAYQWASQALKPVEDDGIEAHKYQQIADKVVAAILNAYKQGQNDVGGS